MSSGARHGLGAVIGVVVIPLIALSLMYGIHRAVVFTQTFMEPPWSERLILMGLFLFAAVLLGLVMGSRLSPVASLIPGLAFAGPGLLWMVAPVFSMRNALDVLPRELDRGYSVLASSGVLLVLGTALIVASLPPSRWRGARAASGPSRHAAAPGAPMLPGAPPPAPAGPGAPMGQAMPQPPYGTPPAAGEQPVQGAVPFAPPAGPAAPGTPASPPRPQSGAVPFDDDAGRPERQRPGSGGQGGQQPGEWTQMYGGDDLRGGGSQQDGR
ncbi:hypothetical protein ACQP1W_06520 [Spirillospora sp. CA-255316]